MKKQNSFDEKIDEKIFFRAGYTVAIGLVAYFIFGELSLGRVTYLLKVVSLLVVAIGVMQFSSFFLMIAKTTPEPPSSTSFSNTQTQAPHAQSPSPRTVAQSTSNFLNSQRSPEPPSSPPLPDTPIQEQSPSPRGDNDSSEG